MKFKNITLIHCEDPILLKAWVEKLKSFGYNSLTGSDFLSSKIRYVNSDPSGTMLGYNEALIHPKILVAPHSFEYYSLPKDWEKAVNHASQLYPEPEHEDFILKNEEIRRVIKKDKTGKLTVITWNNSASKFDGEFTRFANQEEILDFLIKEAEHKLGIKKGSYVVTKSNNVIGRRIFNFYVLNNKLAFNKSNNPEKPFSHTENYIEDYRLNTCKFEEGGYYFDRRSEHTYKYTGGKMFYIEAANDLDNLPNNRALHRVMLSNNDLNLNRPRQELNHYWLPADLNRRVKFHKLELDLLIGEGWKPGAEFIFTSPEGKLSSVETISSLQAREDGVYLIPSSLFPEGKPIKDCALVLSRTIEYPIIRVENMDISLGGETKQTLIEESEIIDQFTFFVIRKNNEYITVLNVI
jgi:hypothetical protein